jgi:hypothetical protein
MTDVHVAVFHADAPVKRSWVYLKQGDKTTLLRSDDEGRLLATTSSDARPGFETFVKPLVLQVPVTVEVASSQGGLPIPSDVLGGLAAGFCKRDLALSPDMPAGRAAIAPNLTNTVQIVPTVKIDVPPIPIEIEEPSALGLWPFFKASFPDDYATDGLPQGRALWTGNHLAVRDGEPSPPADTKSLPQDLGVVVRGKVNNGAKQVQLFLLNASGERLKFKPDDKAETAAVDTVTLDVDDERKFAARLFPDKVEAFFGLVQVVLATKQGNPEGLADVVAAILGVQLGMCDDALTSADGTQRGSLVGAADEKHVVDFVVTAVRGPGPAAPLAENLKAEIARFETAAQDALAPHSRCRRMVCYTIKADRQRTLAQGEPAFLMPEMPLWMVELQMLGWNKKDGELLLRLRREQLGKDRCALKVQAAFAIELAWRSPDADLPNPKTENKYRDVDKTFRGAFRKDSDGDPSFESQTLCEATLDIDVSGKLKIGDDGASAVVSETPYAATPYPIDGRRIAATLLDGASRAWGWQGGNVSIPALVVEWQPPIATPEGYELILGGNGTLKLEKLVVDDQAILPPKPPEEDDDDDSPDSTADAAVMSLPTFRVKGTNPPADAIEKIRDAAIHDVMRANPNAGQVRMLNAEVWRWLAARLVAHESGGKHFDTSTGRVPYRKMAPYQCHGVQAGMPRFGAPSGFGLIQHDPPLGLDDLWSFYANVRQGMKFLIMTKGGEAYQHLNGLHALDQGSQLDKAVLVRETVRRYNGGREFTREGGHWIIHTTVSAKYHEYPNVVLDTQGDIEYSPDGIGMNHRTHRQLVVDVHAIDLLVGSLGGLL